MTSRLSKTGEGIDVTPAGPTLPGITHHYAQVNGTRLHYVAAGTSGSPVLLVHGFPETWWAFRKLIPLLAASHRVFAVDLRGFGDSWRCRSPRASSRRISPGGAAVRWWPGQGVR
jgi:pimeloyl-ACP methyl ester carboxylesterase